MGGGGSMMAANQSLKNNKSLLSKRKEKGFGFVSSSKEKTEYDLPNASPQKLEEIRSRLKRENKQKLIKLIFILCFIGLSLVSLFIYFA